MIYALFTLETFLPLKHSPSFFSPIFLREKKNFSSLEIAQEFRYNHHWNIEVSGFRSPRESLELESLFSRTGCSHAYQPDTRTISVFLLALNKQAFSLHGNGHRPVPNLTFRCSLAQCLRAMQSSQPHEYVIRACAIESKPIGHSSHLPSRVFQPIS